ncbi:hypothetical protein HKCCE3408_13275 [Rhodobacterales bacterium HKCCE3408]|nr:hypothetical protein [Rhodobacterales bacterium HKCCE3408]
MRLTEVRYGDGTPIDGYGPGFFRVGGTVHEGAVLVLPGSVTSWQGYDAHDPIAGAAERIDVILVGTGAEIGPIPEPFRAKIEAAGIGIEIMASAAACRTYNVLLGEGRRIGAALLPV